MLAESVAVWHHKGGVGKTTLVTTYAAYLAAKGWDILLVDMDVQGDVAKNFGMKWNEQNDQGVNLANAIQTKGATKLVPVKGVRPNLDIVFGGIGIEVLANFLTSYQTQQGQPGELFDAAFAPIAQDYDLILFDLSPTYTAMHQAVFSSVHFIVLVAEDEYFSEDNSDLTLSKVALNQESRNRDLEILGLVINKLDPTVRKKPDGKYIEALSGGQVRLLGTAIRKCRADDMAKRRGLTPYEFAGYYESSKKQVLKVLQENRKNKGVDVAKPPKAVPKSVLKMAAEMNETFEAVTLEYLNAHKRWKQRRKAEVAS